MRDYIPRMLDIANQLTDKWTRLNPGDEVDVPASMTALTLDTIALCGFDYRFNSFYRDTPHPFVEAMVRFLLTAQTRARRLPALNRLRIREQRQLDDDQTFMKDLVGKLISERRQQGGAADNSDLLGRMLTGVDPQSGKGLPDDNIISQCLTFLIAGHETTSGLISFAIYYLVKNPDYAKRARTEIDEVFGDSASPSYEQVHRLTYVLKIFEETLRLWPTARCSPARRAPTPSSAVAMRSRRASGTVLIPMLHRHQGVWGADVEQFNPDHLSPQHKTALPPNAYKPFGTGQRACIGRQFALQEATLVLGMLLKRFELVDHLNYQLKTKQTLTVKPEEFRIQGRPRECRTLPAGVAPTAARAAWAKTSGGPRCPRRPNTAHVARPVRAELGTAEANREQARQ
jgi:cytochrome P450/NADPH-cytochrome P450 reductase